MVPTPHLAGGAGLGEPASRPADLPSLPGKPTSIAGPAAGQELA